MGIVHRGPPIELISKLKETFCIATFVETGTYQGDTAYWASGVFDHVITIEASKSLYEGVVEKYGHTKNVEFIHGDSREKLKGIIAKLDGPSIFWLDAHWSGGTTYGENDPCPLIEEIKIINSSEYEHFVLIDDARLFTSPPPDPHPIEQWPDICVVISALSSSDKVRYIVIFEDVIIAVPSLAKHFVAQYCQDKNTKSWKERSTESDERKQPADSGLDVMSGERLLAGQARSNCVKTIDNDDVLKDVQIYHDASVFDEVGFDDCNPQINGEYALLPHLIKPGDVVFDVGANKGEWSGRILSTVRTVRIYSFEPVPDTFAVLKNTLDNLGPSLYNTAISDTDGEKTFFYYHKNSTLARLSSFYRQPDAEKKLGMEPLPILVQAQTLDSFCKKHLISHIDFLKIDTEGGELDVLRGAVNLLLENRIKKLQFEYGGTYTGAGITLRQVCELLSSYGYAIFRILPDGLIHIGQWRDSLENYRYSNYLAVSSKYANKYKVIKNLPNYETEPDNDESGMPHSVGLINGVIFSKDRAMQLDATIRSFLLNCKDHHFVNLKVIYKVSNSYHKESYNKLIREYKFIEFIEEEDFRKQLLSNLAHSKYVLFLVDNNIFVRDFRLSEIAEVLQKNSDALGFSLRLGKNINYHYPSSSKETTLPFIDVTGKVLEYDWTGKNRYFGYPLEVSSSVYRTDDVLPLLTKLDFQGPNTLEAEIARSKNAFANSKKNLLCFQQSVTFCNPVNVVQDVFPDNRSGNKREYSPDSLARMFNAGYRIDVAKFLNFIPSSCHQEVQFEFIKSNSESSGPGYNCPTVSIYMAVYNSEKYLAQTLDSILSQTFRDFEIVIADDGSMDNSAEILKRYEKADSRIRVLQLPHVGVVEARNEAIKRCNPNSKYLINHDSDDMSSPTKLARLVEYIETHPEIAIVGCFAEYFDDEGNFKGQPPIEWLPERIRQTFGEVNSMIHSASLIRRQVFEKIGSYSKDFPVTQDYDFFARALMAGFELANIPEVLHKIRLHPKSIGNAHAASVKIAADRVRKKYKSHQQKERASDKPRLIKGGLKLNNALLILHTVEFYSPHVGGAELVVQQLSERLAKRGHNVTVATTRLAERTFDQLNGVQIEEFDVWGSIARGFTGSDIARYQQFLLKHPADIMMNYAAQQWATDLAFDTLASTGNRRINIIAPCGYSALSDSKTLQMPQFVDYFNKVIPTYLPKYDTAVYHSGRYQDYEFAQNHGFNNSVIIPNGVCEEEFSQTPKVAFRQKYNITTKYLGLCVANFYRGKGQDKIIECVRQMNRPDFTMVFIGKESSELRKLYELASGLNVSFCVGIERKDTLAAYHEADIFLFGSEKECSPLVIVEAKASRTPFVSTDCGNVREWKGGVVCASEKMAFYANRILDEEVTRKNLAEEGWKDWKEKLTLKSVVDRYEELYLRLHWKKSGSRTKSQLQMPNAKISKGSQKKNEKQAKEDITALIFSKDRALQLQATIESFLLHCQDEDTIDLVVLYKTSNELHGGQYAELKKKFSGIDFVEESNFREQVLSAIEKCDYILFLVDDNIFVKPFSMKDISKALQREKDAVGFSLRLGKNTNYCYPFSSQQALPQFKKFSKGILKYYWPDAEYDFGYPLEVSSSVYRCQDMLQLLNRKEFVNPNTLESLMNQNKNLYNSLPYLLTYEESVTFANPVNIVQNVYENKHGTINNYTSEDLADCFSQGMAVDVEKYIGLTPNAAHQEAELYFIGPSISSTAKAEDVVEISGMKPIEQYPDSKPKFSIIMANYNNENYIAEAIESVLNQTFRNWELIIIEDCSTDNSLQIIKRYLNDKRIRLIQHYQNRGYVAALKTGIENGRSEYFGILDSDDCLTSSAIETMYSYHVRFPDCGLIYSQFVFCHEDLTPRNIGFCAEIPADKTNLDADVVSHFKTLKLRDYLKTSGYDEDILYAEDKDIFYKMEEVAKLKFVDQCLYLYRELPNSQGHDPVKASIGRQSGQRARLNALRRRGLVPMTAKQQKSESVVLEQFAIGDRYALGSSYLKVGRYSEAQAAFESILTSLTQTLKLGKSQLSGRKLENYNNMAQLYLSSSTKLAQCYMKQGKYDKVKQICTHLLNNQYLDLPEEQKASIHSVLAKLESIKLPAVSSTGNSPRNPFWGQEEPLVSVYVVTYNMERFIRQAIDSVLAQTYQNLELLIVDDGSTDATKDIVASYSDDRIRCIYKPHKNFASGMNVAISKAKGEYLTGVDSDDFIATDYIEKLLTCARKHPEIDYFYPAKLVLVDESGNPTGVVWDYLDFSDNSALPAFLFGNGYSPIPNSPSLKRKSLFGKVGPYEELDTVEDFVFLCKNALRISFKRVEEHSTYFYRRTLEGNCYKFKARNQITAQALNDMVSMYPAEVLYPQIAGINDSALREQQYYKYLMTTFYKHVNGHMVRYGEYFQQYGDYYKEKLLDHMAKVDKALSSVDGVPPKNPILLRS